MEIQGAGLQRGTTAPMDNRQREISALQQQKQQLERQLRQVEDNKSLSEQKRREKKEALQKQISKLDEQIQSVQQSSSAESEPEAVSERLRYDTLEKTAQSAADLQDNTYRVEQEEDGLKIRFNRLPDGE